MNTNSCQQVISDSHITASGTWAMLQFVDRIQISCLKLKAAVRDNYDIKQQKKRHSVLHGRMSSP